MSRFLRKAAAFSLIQLAIFAVLVIRSRSDGATDFYAAAIDKHDAAERISGPRMLIVGGSNVAFGIDSAELERRAGMPVVNLGLHASVGLDYMLREAADVARSGDVIVLSPEYEHFHQNAASPAVLFRMIQHRPESVRYLTANSAVALLDSGLPCLHQITRRGLKWKRHKSIESWKNGIDPYFRQAFNERGDVVAHHRMASTYTPERAKGEAASLSLSANDSQRLKNQVARSVDQLNRFAEDCQQRGILVYLAHPPRSRSSAEPVEAQLAVINESIQSALQFPVLTRRQDLILDDSCFYDTCYHLTESGRRLRTDALATGLAMELARRGSGPIRDPIAAEKNRDRY